MNFHYLQQSPFNFYKNAIYNPVVTVLSLVGQSAQKAARGTPTQQNVDVGKV